MRLVILYHPKSDHIGLVDSYTQDFRRFKGRNIEKISLETVEGAEMAKLYDIVRYPALLVIGPDGSLSQQWQGTLLPLMDQLSYYAGEPDASTISRQGRKISAHVT
jgi:hypothetical protein